MTLNDQFLWVEKYRPKKISETILPTNLQATFQKMVETKEIPNLLLVGRPGTGKTTVARAMLEEIGFDYLFVPASLKGNIDLLRNEIATFASSMSFSGGRRYVILDEADYLSGHHVQPALRNFIEEYAANCGFILTANYKNKLLPAIQSRCSTIEFDFSKEDLQKLTVKFFKRVCEILEAEKIPYDKKVVASYIKQYLDKNNLDFRKIISELQRYSASGQVDTGLLAQTKNVTVNELVAFMKEKDFTNVRKWVGENTSNETYLILRNFYDTASQYFQTSYIPELVLLLGKYSQMSTQVVDQEICLAAFCVEVMVGAEFKT